MTHLAVSLVCLAGKHSNIVSALFFVRLKQWTNTLLFQVQIYKFPIFTEFTIGQEVYIIKSLFYSLEFCCAQGGCLINTRQGNNDEILV